MSDSDPSRVWRCGHPRTRENTKLVRNGTGAACLTCFRAKNAAYMRRKRAKRPLCPPCEYCGAQMVQTHFDTFECGEACVFAVGERPEWEWTAAFLAGSIAERQSRDSDGSGEAGQTHSEAEGLDPKGDSAGLSESEGIAQ